MIEHKSPVRSDQFPRSISLYVGGKRLQFSSDTMHFDVAIIIAISATILDDYAIIIAISSSATIIITIFTSHN